jgi:cytochrome c peroxidase
MSIKKSTIVAVGLIGIIVLLWSCNKDVIEKGDLVDIPYNPVKYSPELPPHFPRLESPADNPLTVDGILLGRHLFYDPILSGDSTMSCSTCHMPHKNFRDDVPLSLGIAGLPGKRSSMTLVNVAFAKNGLFWDGRAVNLEEQALLPVEDPLELNASWPVVIEKIKNHPQYPSWFRKAFGISDKSQITKELAAKALAQFERTIISKDTKFDKIFAGLAAFSDMELIGYEIYMDSNPDLPDAECGHCHNIPLHTSDDFFNNGLQFSADWHSFADMGRGAITGNILDNGKMKAPTLRNVMISSPFMHNGSMETIDEVLDHYLSGGLHSPNRDPLLSDLQGAELDDFYRRALKVFLHTLTDTVVLTRPELQNPWQ